MSRIAGAALVALALCAAATPAEEDRERGEWASSGELALELRWFPDSPAFADQFDGAQPSATLEPELRWRSANGRHRLELAAFGRYDGRDAERTHGDLRAAAYRYVGDGFELLAGVSRVFWGVAESRHLVDVVNQTDAVEDVDEEDKLGQPMLQLAVERAWGRLELFALPGFRERTFPGRAGRPRPPLPVDVERPRYESGAGDRRVDWAARWSRVAGGWDLGAHLFHGTGREPSFEPATGDRPGRRGTLAPVYRVTTQAGVDVQYTRGAWLWKLEALARDGHGETFGAAVAGFERTWFQIGGSAADLGLLVELHRDGRDATAPPTIFDDDTFLGARLALNDVQSTQLLAGAVIDHDDRSIAALIEAERRLGHRFTLELEARLFSSRDPFGELAAFDRDGFVTLRAAWHW